MEERVGLDMGAAVAAIRVSKVLTVHGSADAVIPLADGQEFAARLPGSELVVLQGADHNFTAGFSQQLVAAVVDWVQANA
jgi:pimeloyl-ACP methyl ester carboxylesterase